MDDFFNCANNPFGYGSTVWIGSKLLGMVPFGSTPNGEYKLKPLNVFYTLVGFSINTYCCIDNFDISGVEQTYPVICVIGHIMHTILGFINSNLAYMETYWNMRGLLKVNNLMKEVDATIARITGYAKDYVGECNCYQLRLVIWSNAFFVLIALFDAMMFYVLFGEFILQTCFCYVFPYMVSSMVQFQFITLVHHLSLRFKEVNRVLLHMISVSNEIPVAKIPTKVNSDNMVGSNANAKLKPPTPILIISGQSIEDTPTKATNNQADDATSKSKIIENLPKMPSNMHIHMDTLFILHDKLLDICELVNSVYAIQIVVFITIAFIITLFGFFFETKIIFWVWGTNIRLILIATSYLLWAILMALIIFRILTTCTSTRDEAYESALIVHKILQSKPLFMLNDDIYYNKMKSFTLQILHRKKTFGFSGLGLFQLDFTFVFSAVSAATSYLIVLMQFDISSSNF